jgi:hypothetical protein
MEKSPLSKQFPEVLQRPSFPAHSHAAPFASYRSAMDARFGVVFRFDRGLPPFVTFVDSCGQPGMTVQTLVKYFTPGSKVF